MDKKFFALFLMLAFLTTNAFAALRSVGPKGAEHGFPLWYKDSKNLKLGLCLEGPPNCLELEGMDTTRPLSFPDNFPEEAFWWTAETEVNVRGGGSVLLVLALEAAFGNEVPEEGQRVSFARVRIRGFNLPRGSYRITHPYGVKTFRVTARTRRNINSTSDVGIAPEVFTGALKGAVGPFLVWDPAFAPKAPAGYVGNPNVAHRVTGSPKGTNYLRVQRLSGGAWVTVGLTRLFNVSGKKVP